MKVVLAGGTGFVGRVLRRELMTVGHEVTMLNRGSIVAERERCVHWDGKTLGEWANFLDGADAVINLAGENIASKRWTPSRKQRLISSRVNPTRAIVNAIAQAKRRPLVLINASAVGYYGDAGDLELADEDPMGAGFLATTCDCWETEALKARSLGVRVVLARLGPVLGEQGGMLSRMVPPFRFFMGMPLGTGKQWIPWIHIEDAVNAILFVLSRENISGPVNITSGAPVTMKEFCHTLARVLRRPCGPPLPSFLLRMLMGEMAAIVLSSQRAFPRKLLNAGHRFQYQDLFTALSVILKKSL